MPDLEHAQMMLTVARRDLKAMDGMKAHAEFFDDEIFGFHAQQAAEKALKAWLSLAGVEYPRTHDLRQLFELLKQSGESIPEAFHQLMHLTDFAVQFRYESLVALDADLNRTELTQQVGEVIAYVEKLIQDLEEAE